MLIDTNNHTSVFAHGRNRVTYSLLTGLDVMQLLDYGCGNARFAITVAKELGITVHACDIDVDQIESLARHNGNEVNFFVVSEEYPELPLADNQVSAAICCDVLEHMPAASRMTVLREIQRVLTHDGVLIVTTPHKGLFSALDPENAKAYFPRIHKYVYTLAKGRDEYERVYGAEEAGGREGAGARKRFGNYSAGSKRHVHFSARELSELVTAAGFEVEEIRYFSLIHPLIRTILWIAENLAGRVKGADRLRVLCWKAYLWDADLEPGKLAFSVAIRAGKLARPLGHAG
jgi:SAM-dependent methyltransferase